MSRINKGGFRTRFGREAGSGSAAGVVVVSATAIYSPLLVSGVLLLAALCWANRNFFAARASSCQAFVSAFVTVFYLPYPNEKTQPLEMLRRLRFAKKPRFLSSEMKSEKIWVVEEGLQGLRVSDYIIRPFLRYFHWVSLLLGRLGRALPGRIVNR